MRFFSKVNIKDVMLINQCFLYLAPTLFITLRVVDPMLPITVKLAVILKLELVRTHASHLSRRNVANQKKTLFA